MPSPYEMTRTKYATVVDSAGSEKHILSVAVMHGPPLLCENRTRWNHGTDTDITRI